MMQKMKAHFLGFGPRRFVIVTVILLLVLDLVNSYYLKIYWVQRDLSNKYVSLIAEKQGLSVGDLSPESVTEVKQLIENAVLFFLFIVLVNNLFFYVFYLRKKLWAQGYVLFYALTNAILAVLFLVEGPVMGWAWFAYNISTVLIYTYMYFGVKLLKNETVVIPADGKTVQ